MMHSILYTVFSFFPFEGHLYNKKQHFFIAFNNFMVKMEIRKEINCQYETSTFFSMLKCGWTWTSTGRFTDPYLCQRL